MTDKKLTLKLKVMKKILGLDLGTNSIGWALVDDLYSRWMDFISSGLGAFELIGK